MEEFNRFRHRKTQELETARRSTDCKYMVRCDHLRTNLRSYLLVHNFTSVWLLCMLKESLTIPYFIAHT